MIIFFVLFILPALISIGLAIDSYVRPKANIASYHFLRLSVGLGYIVTFLVCLSLVFLNPYWVDNGAKTRIIFPEHFFWALFMASFFQCLIVPGTIGILYLFRKIYRTFKQKLL